jgi:peptidoglycan/LPS O-acetylase OafA/YrhL
LFVDFFFVLSGFVIFANYETRLVRGFGIGRFMLLRLGRLYPLHVFILACFIGFELIRVALPSLSLIDEAAPFTSSEQSMAATVANIFLTHGLNLFDSLTWNRPSWSISTEFYAYLVFALMVVNLRRGMWPAMAIVMIFSPILIASLSEHNMNTTFDFGFIRCLYGFTAGTVAFRVYDLRGRKSSAPVNRVTATLAEGMSLALVVVFVLLAGETAISVLAPYVFLITVVTFSLECGLISHVMTYRPLAALGALSYSIYMIHLFVQCRVFNAAQLLETMYGVHALTYVDAEHKKLLGTQLWYGDFLHAAMLPVVIAASYVTYRFIEEPSRTWFRTVSERLCGARNRAVHHLEGSAVPLRDPT